MNDTSMKSLLKVLFMAVLLAACNGNNPTFDASGTFEADEIIVSSEATGTLREFSVEEGVVAEEGQALGWVDSTQLYLKKKQLLAQIDAILARSPDIATQLASYQAQLETAERERTRVENLFKVDAATEKQVDDANATASRPGTASTESSARCGSRASWRRS